MGTDDKRHFRRYKKRSDCSIKLAKNSCCTAETVDYSLVGVCADFVGRVPVKPGDLVDVTISDPQIEAPGEVVWVSSGRGGMRVGIRSLGILKGRIRDFGLADTLIGLQRTQKTGVLTVTNANSSKNIYIKNGDMVFAASNLEKDRMGDVLLRAGKITLEQFYDSIREMKAAGVRQGAALVRLGHLSPQNLISAVNMYIEEIILSLFEFDDGAFEFREGRLPTDEVITLKLSAANLIFAGIGRINSTDRIISGLPSADTVLTVSDEPMNLFQDISLDEPAKKVLSLIDGMRQLKAIVSDSGMPAFITLKAVYALMSIRMVGTLPDAGALDQLTGIRAEIVEEIVEERDDRATEAMIEEMHSKHLSLGYYGVLGVKDTAPVNEIKRAYYKAARRFHPDMHFHSKDDTLKDKLSDIFSYIYEAYSTLTEPAKRADYDKKIAAGKTQKADTKEMGRARFEEAEAEFRKEDYKKAERLFGQAVYFDGTKPEYRYHYGLALSRQGRIKEAAKEIEEASRLDPMNPRYLTQLGDLYIALGFPTRARGYFAKALKYSPDNPRAIEGISRIDAGSK